MRWKNNSSGGVRVSAPEDALQAAIVAFHAGGVVRGEAILFAVPNGEKREKATAARLSGITAADRERLGAEVHCVAFGQGVLPGVSDLIVLLCDGRVLLVELKIPRTTYPPPEQPEFPGIPRVVVHEAGTLSKGQKQFRDGAGQLGHVYRVIRSVMEYADLLEEFGVRLRSRPAGPGWRPPAGRSRASRPA